MQLEDSSRKYIREALEDEMPKNNSGITYGYRVAEEAQALADELYNARCTWSFKSDEVD